MRDWTSYVERKLGSTGLPRRCEQEIVAELASHFEDMGNSAADAENQVSDWGTLARNIRKAKEDYMSARVRNFWVPGLVVDLVAVFLLRGLQIAGVRPIVLLTHPIPLVIYLPWLLLLPLVGGMGAYWSRQAGGSMRTRVLVATFPCVVLGAAMIAGAIGSMIAALIGRDPGYVRFLAMAASQTLLVWAILPAIALGLGALPFVRSRQATETPRSDAATA